MQTFIVFTFATIVEGRTSRSWVIPECPLCGCSHSHGAGLLSENPRTYLTGRVPHCEVQKGVIPRGDSDPDEERHVQCWLTDDPSIHGKWLLHEHVMELAELLRQQTIADCEEAIGRIGEELKRREGDMTEAQRA